MVMDLDTALFRQINALAGRSLALDAAMITVARYAPVIFALALVGLWLTWRPQLQRGAAVAGGAALLALGAGQVIGMAFPRARPYEVLSGVRLLIKHSPDTSFPSDHAILVFAVAVVVWQVHRRAGAALLALAVWTSVARVFVGAHYPGDVLGGALLGTALALGVWWLSMRRPFVSALHALFTVLHRLRIAAG